MGNSDLKNASRQVDLANHRREELKRLNQEAMPCGLLAVLVARGQKGEALTSEEASAAFAAGARAFKTGKPEFLSKLFG